MNQKLHKSLIASLAFLAVASFALGMYLETFRLEFLQAHPISVNLLSSVVGFASVTLVVGVVFNRMRARTYRWGFSQQIVFGRFESRVLTILDTVESLLEINIAEHNAADDSGVDPSEEVRKVLDAGHNILAKMWSPDVRSSYNFPYNGLGATDSLLNAVDSLLDGQVTGLMRVFDFSYPEHIDIEVFNVRDASREIRSLQLGGESIPLRTLGSLLRRLDSLVSAVYLQPEFQRFHKWFLRRNVPPAIGDGDALRVVDSEDEFAIYLNYLSTRRKRSRVPLLRHLGRSESS